MTKALGNPSSVAGHLHLFGKSSSTHAPLALQVAVLVPRSGGIHESVTFWPASVGEKGPLVGHFIEVAPASGVGVVALLVAEAGPDELVPPAPPVPGLGLGVPALPVPDIGPEELVPPPVPELRVSEVPLFVPEPDLEPESVPEPDPDVDELELHHHKPPRDDDIAQRKQQIETTKRMRAV